MPAPSQNLGPLSPFLSQLNGTAIFAAGLIACFVKLMPTRRTGHPLRCQD
jgi:hypothetical protein